MRHFLMSIGSLFVIFLGVSQVSFAFAQEADLVVVQNRKFNYGVAIVYNAESNLHWSQTGGENHLVTIQRDVASHGNVNSVVVVQRGDSNLAVIKQDGRINYANVNVRNDTGPYEYVNGPQVFEVSKTENGNDLLVYESGDLAIEFLTGPGYRATSSFGRH